MQRILVSTSTFSEKQLLASYDVLYNPYGRRLSENEVMELLSDFQPAGMIAGVEPLTDKVLTAAKGLKVISRCGVGLDSVDLEKAAELGIKVCITPDAPVPSVAEMALALMLALLRNIPSGDREMRSGNWVKKNGSLLYGKCAGIIGCGRIGSYLAALLKAFSCTVIGYDPEIPSHPVCTMVPLDELYTHADIISLHMPLTPGTRNSIDMHALKKMKKSALLINTARGGIINEDDLYTALKDGIIAGAALDVFSQEPYSGKLMDLGEKIVLSPHQASSALESRIRMEREAVTNLIEHIGADHES
jgi:D-3-phosphoglycerate dehydrogenase / 2-oxoglutarate reductase